MPRPSQEWLQSLGRPTVIAGLLLAMFCVVLAFMESWRLADARRIQIGEANTSGANLAKSLADMTSSTLVETDILLSELVERLETDGTSASSIDRINARLRTQINALPQLQRLSVLDVEGHWIAADIPGLDRTVGHADREYFRYHQLHDDRAPHLGPPIRSKSTDEWIVTVSRRVNDPQGRFAGVALASIALDFFEQHFKRFDIGVHGTIVLARSDGTVISRRPYLESAVGASLAEGQLFREHIAFDNHGVAWITSPFDGVERLTSFHKAERYPIYAIVSLARDEILAPWRDDALVHGGAMLAFLVMIAFVGQWLVRESTSRHRDHLLLEESRAAVLRSNEALATLVREDPLTGIANRREFDRVLTDELTRARRNREPVALLMIDIDHFKSYNDTYGHLIGDDCLRRVAKLIAVSAGRPGDFVARYGGEEFVVVLPATDLVGAGHVARDLQALLARAHLEHKGTALGVVTVSIGIAGGLADDVIEAARDLIERADRALYSAKRGGRDTIRTDRTPRLDFVERPATEGRHRVNEATAEAT